ncbi:MAG: MerR family transcriptional regulator [Sphingomonas sp.]|uniref:MerR family transcriptional regulator n=1 Tax=Sphingomonas sp. TaxID=28214 RepID=UPI00184809CE|nr:MerR family transcriptional regulator [Sphingomonas sp.]
MLDISNVIAAFDEDHASRLTRLSISRLRYWAKTGFFAPSYIEESAAAPYSRFYSFRDIVALRTLEMLRVKNGVPLQHTFERSRKNLIIFVMSFGPRLDSTFQTAKSSSTNRRVASPAKYCLASSWKNTP